MRSLPRCTTVGCSEKSILLFSPYFTTLSVVVIVCIKKPINKGFLSAFALWNISDASVGRWFRKWLTSYLPFLNFSYKYSKYRRIINKIHATYSLRKKACISQSALFANNIIKYTWQQSFKLLQ